jgi:hypothetical protein
MKKTKAIVEINGKGTFYVYTPDLKSTLLGEGSSAAEAIEDFEACYREDLVAHTKSLGETLPEELVDLTFEYKYDIASFLDLFYMFNVSKLGEYLGINPSLMRQYKSGNTYISAKKMKEIEAGVNNLGKFLASAKFVR